MKNLLIICLLVFSVLAVNAQDKKKTRKQKRAEREAQLIEQTQKLVEAKAWQFDASQMQPSKGGSRTLTTPYKVVVKDENVNSYLPYFGVAYSADYGSTESPLIFEAPIEEYGFGHGKKGSYIIKFRAKNKSDVIEFTFNISPAGSASLSLNSTNRQHISFYGNLVPIEEKEEE